MEYTGKRSPAGWEAARVLYWKGVPPRVIARVGDGRNVGALGFGASCGSEAAIQSVCVMAESAVLRVLLCLYVKQHGIKQRENLQ